MVPLGGYNITKDISAQQIEEEDAEELKLKFGSAYTEDEEVEAAEETKTYPVTEDRKIDAKLLSDIVESRVEEIIANVVEQIRQSGFANDLMAGIVLTGGGANLRNMELAFKKRTNFEKIRTSKFITNPVEGKNPDIKSRDGSLNTVLSLLIKGKDNCYGAPMESECLFGPNGETYQERQQELMRQKAEEEARRKAEEEAARKAEEDAAAQKQKEEEEQQRKENSIFNKVKKMIINIMKDED